MAVADRVTQGAVTRRLDPPCLSCSFERKCDGQLTLQAQEEKFGWDTDRQKTGC